MQNKAIKNKYLQNQTQAFPPELSKKEQPSPFYEILTQNNLKNCRITYRPINDREDLKMLKFYHDQWFPITYNDEYYESAYIGLYKKQKVYTIIACIEIDNNSLPIGCIIYRVQKANFKHFQFSLSDLLCSNNQSLYIMTLGVTIECRKLGIASKLIDQMIIKHMDDISIKYVALHVITYNSSAINFYKKQKFIDIETNYNHYYINGTLFDAIYFVQCLNKKEYPNSWWRKLLFD